MGILQGFKVSDVGGWGLRALRTQDLEPKPSNESAPAVFGSTGKDPSGPQSTVFLSGLTIADPEHLVGQYQGLSSLLWGSGFLVL